MNRGALLRLRTAAGLGGPAVRPNPPAVVRRFEILRALRTAAPIVQRLGVWWKPQGGNP